MATCQGLLAIFAIHNAAQTYTGSRYSEIELVKLSNALQFREKFIAMPKQSGPFYIEGFYNGMIFYKQNGKYYVRRSSAPTKERMQNDPSFAGSVQSSFVFGTASKASKWIRQGLAQLPGYIQPKNLNPRLNSVNTKIINMDGGENEKKVWRPAIYKDQLTGFRFEEKRWFTCSGKTKVALEGENIKLACEVGLDPVAAMRPNKSATHFKVVLAALPVSDLVYNEQQKDYLFEGNISAMLYYTQTDNYQKITRDLYSGLLELEVPVAATALEKASLMLFVAFYPYGVYNNKYDLYSGSQIKIVDVIPLLELLKNTPDKDLATENKPDEVIYCQSMPVTFGSSFRSLK